MKIERKLLTLLPALFLALSAFAAKKPASSQKAKAAKPAAKAAAPAEAAPATPAAAPAAEAAAPAPAPAPESMDVTITGVARDEISLEKPASLANITFDQVAGLSREGQTDRVLSSPIEHMTGKEQMALLKVDSQQTFLGLPVRIPEPPLIRMELSPGLSSYLWELQILDQNDRVIKAREGTTLPRYVMDWDGFQDGVFKLQAGSAYTPVLLITDDRKRTQRIFGEPVHFAALQYVQDGMLHIEFDNNRLFERGRADFATDVKSYLGASLNLLRQCVGKPIRVVVYAQPGATHPVQQRLENLRAFYMDGLALEKDMISFAVLPVKDRGDITEILAVQKP